MYYHYEKQREELLKISLSMVIMEQVADEWLGRVMENEEVHTNLIE